MNDLTGRQPKALVSALQLLEAVARAGPGVTAAELASATGLARATAYRLVNLLVEQEYVVRLPDLSGFALGTRVAGFVEAAAPVRVCAAVRAELLQLRAGMRPAVHLYVVRAGAVRSADPDPSSPLGVADGDLARHRCVADVLGRRSVTAEGTAPDGGGWLVVGVGPEPLAVLVVTHPPASPWRATDHVDRVLGCSKVLEPLL